MNSDPNYSGFSYPYQTATGANNYSWSSSAWSHNPGPSSSNYSPHAFGGSSAHAMSPTLSSSSSSHAADNEMNSRIQIALNQYHTQLCQAAPGSDDYARLSQSYLQLYQHYQNRQQATAPQSTVMDIDRGDEDDEDDDDNDGEGHTPSSATTDNSLYSPVTTIDKDGKK